MHLNVLYRAAEAGKQSLVDCANALTSASRVRVRLPLKFWRRYQARRHLDTAKHHLRLVRDNVSIAGMAEQRMQIDSSGGFNVADLLCGGLLVELDSLALDLARINDTVDQVATLLLRMRKAGAVG